MNNPHPSSEDLVAPCGMHCAVCSRYLSHAHDLKRSQCAGCRPEHKRCSYLFAKCTGINHARKGTRTAAFCSACPQYPCRQIDRMDDRYRKNYGLSVKENLACIGKKGVARFIQEQYEKYRCPKCGGWISIHNGKCFACDTITRLVEKRGR